MTQYRKKPVVIEATRWLKNGDHPLDGDEVFTEGQYKGEKLEGKIVRYFHHPGTSDTRICETCGHAMAVHGWIDTLEGGHIVCPGDWIITGVKGEHYPCKPDIFEQTYEKVEL